MTRSGVRLIVPFSFLPFSALLIHFVSLRLVSVVASETERNPLHNSVLRKPAKAQWRRTRTGFFIQTNGLGCERRRPPKVIGHSPCCVSVARPRRQQMSAASGPTRGRVPTLPARRAEASRGRQLPTQVRHAEACRRSGQAGVHQFCVSFGCHSVKRA
jgi:hypothetical protein